MVAQPTLLNYWRSFHHSRSENGYASLCTSDAKSRGSLYVWRLNLVKTVLTQGIASLVTYEIFKLGHSSFLNITQTQDINKITVNTPIYSMYYSLYTTFADAFSFHKHAWRQWGWRNSSPIVIHSQNTFYLSVAALNWASGDSGREDIFGAKAYHIYKWTRCCTRVYCCWRTGSVWGRELHCSGGTHITNSFILYERYPKSSPATGVLLFVQEVLLGQPDGDC